MTIEGTHAIYFKPQKLVAVIEQCLLDVQPSARFEYFSDLELSVFCKDEMHVYGLLCNLTTGKVRRFVFWKLLQGFNNAVIVIYLPPGVYKLDLLNKERIPLYSVEFEMDEV